jgi:hypothetical protein
MGHNLSDLNTMRLNVERSRRINILGALEQPTFRYCEIRPQGFNIYTRIYKSEWTLQIDSIIATEMCNSEGSYICRQSQFWTQALSGIAGLSRLSRQNRAGAGNFCPAWQLQLEVF